MKPMKFIGLLTACILLIFLTIVEAQAIETNVIFQNRGNETLADSYVAASTDANTNFGTQNTMKTRRGGGAGNARIYIMFALNQSIFHPRSNISEAYVILGIGGQSSPAESTYEEAIHEVNSTFDELNITWNNQPCGTTQDSLNSSQCNSSFADNKSVYQNSNLPSNVTFNVTLAVREAIKEGRNNITLVLKSRLEAQGSTDAHTYISSESTGEAINPNINPMLNITFYPYTESTLINFSIYDEITKTFINDKVSLNLITSQYSESINFSGGSLLKNANTTGNYRIEYNSDKYTKRDYYLTLNNLSQDDINITLYLLSTGNSTDVTITLKDGSGDAIENGLLQLKRYYVDTNSYDVVAMSKTDFQGQSVLDVDFNDAYYQIFASKDNFTVNTAGSKIFSTSILITLVTATDPFTRIDAENGMTSTLTFNNETQVFSYTFSDQNGVSRRATLEVREITGSEEILRCSNTVTSSSSTILCTVNTSNSTNSFLAVGKIAGSQEFTTNTLYIIGKTIANNFKGLMGDGGLYLTIMFAGTAAGLGAFNPAVAIIMYLAGLAVMGFTGFGVINLVVFFSFLIFGLMIIWKLRT